MTARLVEVALGVPANDGIFTYRVPAALAEEAVSGRRVLVPLGSRTLTGVVLGDAKAKAQGELRDVLRLLDDGPLIPADILALVRFAAAHYLSPLGPAVKAALPPGIDVRQSLVARLTEAGKALLEPRDAARTNPTTSATTSATANPTQTPNPTTTATATAAFSLRPSTVDSTRAGTREALFRTRQLLRRVSEGRALSPVQLTSLERRGLVELRRAEAVRVSAPQVEMVSPAADAARRLPECVRAPRQTEVLTWLLARGGEGVPVEEVLAAFPRARPHLRKLELRKLVARHRRPAGPLREMQAPWGETVLRPTRAQAEALAVLSAAVEAERFAPFLVHGVTGSGKTWVYLEAIAKARAKGRGALALVPEIALTPQLAGRFRARFGDDVAVLHSGLTERERLSEWHRVRDGHAGIVVGARSAVFAPVANLGIVVVDEEHEPSYKQEERLRYHARDLALVRAQKAGAVCVLGSATPSLETLRRAQEGKLATLTLPERVDGRAMPVADVVDLKGALRPSKDGVVSLISRQLAEAVRETVARREQAILFLNRRGHTRTLLCRSCGAAVGCPNCSVALVLHKQGGDLLRCHLCGHAERPREACSACGARKLVPLSAGTERVEEEMRELLPEARIGRLDRDAAAGPGKAAALLARFARRELDVLVGTQMVAKGHDFPGVTLVGVLDADGPLHLPDFRAAERCVQLLAQVAGRAGRGREPGRVLVQAFRPDDPAVAFGCAHDYLGFAALELARRQALGFPPFTRLAALRLQGNAEGRVHAAAERLAARARTLLSRGERAEVLGPAPAPLSRLKGKHRYQLLLRAADHAPLHRIARDLVREHDERGYAGVELAVDVDPVALI